MKFDLLVEPWIAVSEKKTGAIVSVNIRDALVRSHEWGEIQSASPLVTIAVLRMLLAIVHRACQPSEKEGWAEMWQAGKLPKAEITAYLDKFSDRFDLFDVKRPFMQIGGMTMTQAGSMAKLSTEAATGNNPTLFDHASDDAPIALTPAEAAQRLLAAQHYALGFGMAADAKVDGNVLPRPYLADGICLRGVTLFLTGESLFQTLLLNLVSGRLPSKSIPFWEVADPEAELDKVVKGKRESKAASGFIERYAWPSRMVRLLPDDDGMVRRAYFTQGREADKGIGDPMKVFVKSPKEGTYALGLNADKAAWRDLHTYLGANESEVPKVLKHAESLVFYSFLPREYRLNVVGLATDPGKAGKFLLWRHDRMSLPAELLKNPDRVGELSTAIGDAEFVAGELRRRMYNVAKEFLPTEEPDPKDIENLIAALAPRRAYWARLEAHFARFLNGLGTDPEAAMKTWRDEAAREAERALRGSCEQLGHSTRAIKATARVSYRFIANKAEVEKRMSEAKQAKKVKSKTAAAKGDKVTA